jgi:hypothetical protein
VDERYRTSGKNGLNITDTFIQDTFEIVYNIHPVPQLTNPLKIVDILDIFLYHFIDNITCVNLRCKIWSAHWVALRPDVLYFITLLCLTPDNCTCQGESSFFQFAITWLFIQMTGNQLTCGRFLSYQNGCSKKNWTIIHLLSLKLSLTRSIH